MSFQTIEKCRGEKNFMPAELNQLDYYLKFINNNEHSSSLITSTYSNLETRDSDIRLWIINRKKRKV